MASVPRNGVVYCEDGENDDICTLILKRARVCADKLFDSKRPHLDLQVFLTSIDPRVLLRRVYFLNEERTRYVSLGFYPADNYQVLTEFRGPRITPITLTEQHVMMLMENLPALCDAMHRGELYTCKDGSFRLWSRKTNNCARLYRDRKCVSFTLNDLCYMKNMLHMVQIQLSQYILAQAGVMAFAFAALVPIEFVEPPHTTAGLIPYGQLFDEINIRLI